MPEIAEVARIVHYLKKSLAGKTLKSVKAQDDTIVFGKVGTSGAEFQKALSGKKVLDAGQQGKYFWLIMSSPPHPVFHFGMTGWFYIRGEPSMHYRPKAADDTWPPKYWKFALETDETPAVEAAFTDARRLARVRLVDCVAEEIRNTTPLKENGPDPVIDSDILTEEWLEKKMKSKRVPVKALLLDQANISGIGNWVGDEILYHAKLHPEQYSNTFSSAQLKQLHTSIMYICKTAVDLLGDSSKFPDDWLFNHRWGKGKKDAPTTLPNGAKITHITVGGRTSCVVPSVQKKTGAVAGDLKPEDADDADDAEEPKAKKAAKKKSTAKKSEYFAKEEPETKKAGRRKAAPKKSENIAVNTEAVEEVEEKQPVKKTKASGEKSTKTAVSKAKDVPEEEVAKKSKSTKRKVAPEDEMSAETKSKAKGSTKKRKIELVDDESVNLAALPKESGDTTSSKGRRRSDRVSDRKI